ncbi:DUF1415 domain-containing protein [Xylophilus sp. GOD-11R]|uniref:DUF1415 domain-containing protein n=1 Tax=Xylophilus sp. GOD-11R TaxID=3089814 RepID=UPI00298C0F12|nr:DUF1415 domain-containing protein [Xylophilus sp. GOD-11R]WPB57585.1 DUF1415 domain-containing protein [Xylophilus sp. GOD-11R]
MPHPSSLAQDAIADTRRWLERAVIGLNLCPFAKAVQARGQVHYAVCESDDPQALLDTLLDEARALLALEPEVRDTTLLVATGALGDFLDFNDFAGDAEDRLADEGLEGVLQLATFHPHFQFGGTTADDITNATNRSPWPTLHLLREASIDRAVEAFPDAEAIFGRNIETLERIGATGWAALDVGRGSAAGTSEETP